MKQLLALILLTSTAAAIEITPKNPVPPWTQVHVMPSAPNEWITVDPVLIALSSQQEALLSDDNIDALFPELLKTAVVGDYVFTGKPGAYIVRSRVEQNGAILSVQKLVRIAYPEPVPPPVPPGPGPVPPGPGPTPPGPNPPGPTPGPAPFPAPGLTVMILREASPTTPLPASQIAIFNSSKVQQWLNQNTAPLGTNGLDRAWRLEDDDLTDEQIKNLPEFMRVAYRNTVNAAKGVQPWIAISNGATGISTALPLTVDETLALLKKFGG